jgi:hypothetical protein
MLIILIILFVVIESKRRYISGLFNVWFVFVIFGVIYDGWLIGNILIMNVDVIFVREMNEFWVRFIILMFEFRIVNFRW